MTKTLYPSWKTNRDVLTLHTHYFFLIPECCSYVLSLEQVLWSSFLLVLPICSTLNTNELSSTFSSFVSPTALLWRKDNFWKCSKVMHPFFGSLFFMCETLTSDGRAKLLYLLIAQDKLSQIWLPFPQFFCHQKCTSRNSRAAAAGHTSLV